MKKAATAIALITLTLVLIGTALGQELRKQIDKSTPLLGDTGTHEVGHKGKQPKSIKFDGIEGESNDARTQTPNRRRKAQNLLPYVEQDNVYKTRNRKR